MAYKEMKLNPGEAKDLNALWNFVKIEKFRVFV